MQTKLLLEKINALSNSLSQEANLSGIERDLMLSYIRQLYEAYLLPSQSVVHAPVVVEVIAPIAKPTPVYIPTPEPVVVKETVKETVKEKIVEAVVKVVPPIVFEPAEEVEAIPEIAPEPIVIPEPTIEIVPPVEIPIAKPVEVPSVMIHTPVPSAAQPLIQPSNVRVDDDELFDNQASKELSEKLGQAPIDNIKMSMGLNERVLTQNELFAGDHFEFENALARLQSMTNFEEAKTYLLQLAQRYDWATKEKFAKPFIKLVRRKFNR